MGKHSVAQMVAAAWVAGLRSWVVSVAATVASNYALDAWAAAAGLTLVASGLLAGLVAGRLPGSESWRTTVMRPGSHPVQELASAALGMAARTPDTGELLARLLDRDPTLIAALLLRDHTRVRDDATVVVLRRAH